MKIIEKLKEQDDKYHLKDTESFAQRFKANPVVDLFFDSNSSGIEITSDSKRESNNDGKQDEVSKKHSIHICAEITVCGKEATKKAGNCETQKDDSNSHEESGEITLAQEDGAAQENKKSDNQSESNKDVSEHNEADEVTTAPESGTTKD